MGRDGNDVTVATDELSLGAAPRPARPPRVRRVLAGGAAVLVLGAVAAVVVTRPAGKERSVADASAVVSTPARSSPTATAGTADGPTLVSVGGRDAVLLPISGALASAPVPLAAAPDLVAVLAAVLPDLHDVRGGRTPSGTGTVGAYLHGRYGSGVELTVYTLRSAGTTAGSDQYVSRTRFDRSYTVRTEVSAYTGTGWWVHALALAPDPTGGLATGETARLLPLVEDPRLVTG